MDYIWITIAVFLIAFAFAAQKFYQNNFGNTAEETFKFNTVVGIARTLIFAIIVAVMQKFDFGFSWYSLILATVFACLCLAYGVISFRMLEGGQMSTYMLFLMTGGMMLPYVWGIFFLDEEVSILRTVGLIFIIAGVVISNIKKGEDKFNFKYIIMGISVFILNGCGSIVSKLHQIEKNYKTVSSSEFVMLTGIATLATSLIALVIVKLVKKRKTEKTVSEPSSEKTASAEKMSKGKAIGLTFFFGGVNALLGGISYLLQLISAITLPATVVYPFLTGGIIIFTSLAAWVFFKEKPSKKVTVGIILCFAGTCMFL